MTDRESRTNRRRFLSAAAVTGLAAAGGIAPLPLVGAARPRLVVVGGGPGGATVARFVARGGEVDVTLIEPQQSYTTCFFSNLYLGGFRSFESITHDYDGVRRDGVRVLHDIAADIDTAARIVHLHDGAALGYDRLVVAPGIDFRWDAIEGYGPEAAEVMPHAYKAGAQSRLLKQKMESVPDGGRLIIVPPPNPFRCPPGPYERASMIAHWFSQHRPKAKILIIDAKDKHSKQALFAQAWARHYPGMVEWLPADITNGGVKAVRADSMEVVTEDETFTADAVNVIPAQKAGVIAQRAGLADDSGWCPVAADTLASTLAADVHLVGDAIIPGDMPKSAFSANSQAKACANAILAELVGKRRFEPRFRNTCWSLLSTDNAVKVGANYEAKPEGIQKIDGFLSELDESDQTRAATAREALGWYSGITQEVWG